MGANSGDRGDLLYFADRLWDQALASVAGGPPLTVDEAIEALSEAIAAYGKVFRPDATIGERVEFVREQRGLARGELGGRSGVSVRDVETDATIPVGVLEAERLAAGLGVPAEVLIADPVPDAPGRRERRWRLRVADAAATLDPGIAGDWYRMIFAPDDRLGFRVEEMRCMRALTISELAKESGVPFEAVQRIVTGRQLFGPMEKFLGFIVEALTPRGSRVPIPMEVFSQAPEMRLLAARSATCAAPSPQPKGEAAREWLNPELPPGLPFAEIVDRLLVITPILPPADRRRVAALVQTVSETPLDQRRDRAAYWKSEAQACAVWLRVPAAWLIARSIAAPVAAPPQQPPEPHSPELH